MVSLLGQMLRVDPVTTSGAGRDANLLPEDGPKHDGSYHIKPLLR